MRQKTALIPLSVYTFPTLFFFYMFGTHVTFAEIGIMQIIFLYKRLLLHIKGSFEYRQKLVYVLTFAVVMRLGN